MRPSRKVAKQFMESTKQAPLAVFSLYDQTSAAALVRYFHAASGFPVRTTWLVAIKAGNFKSWLGLTYNNVA